VSTPDTALAPVVRPLFTLAFEAMYCRVELRFNDLPLISVDASTSTVDTELPLNPALLPGDNLLSMALQAGAREDAARTPVLLTHPATRCIAEITVRATGAPAGERKRLAGLAYEGGQFVTLPGDLDAPALARLGNLASLINTPQAALGRQALTLQSPFPAWLWSRAEVLTLDDATTADIVGEYRRFWSVLQQKDGAALRALTADNAREMQVAFGLPSLDDAYAMLSLEDLMRQPSVTLLPLPTEGLRVELLADGRVARLLAADGRSAIRLRDNDLDAEGAVSVLFCKVPTRGWIQIR